MCHIQGLTTLEALHITGGKDFTEDHFRCAALLGRFICACAVCSAPWQQQTCKLYFVEDAILMLKYTFLQVPS